MSTTLFAAFGILAPVHGLLRRFTATRLSAMRQSSPGLDARLPGLAALSGPPSRPIQLAATAAQQSTHRANTRPAVHSRSRAHPALRVVRVMESGQATAYGGRMMISGRMADVCAELDRMAEREAVALQASV